MLLEAIFVIIAISIVFCCCTLCCYVVFHYIFTEEKADVQPETEVWEAKHFYDPLPMATPSPPDTIFKPTPYTFKLQNGNGVYSTGLPHAVINPAVLQYPPGHVFDQERIFQPSTRRPPAQDAPKKANKEKRQENRASKKESSRKKLDRSRSRSRSPSPRRNSRRTQNVWSTNTEFQQHNSYLSNHHSQNRHDHPHHQDHQHSHRSSNQTTSQHHQHPKQYNVQLIQEHYDVHPRQHEDHRRKLKQHNESENRYPSQPLDDYDNYHYHEHDRQHKHDDHHLHRHHSQPYQAFMMASTHATNYTPSTKRKLYRSTTSYRDDVT